MRHTLLALTFFAWSFVIVPAQNVPDKANPAVVAEKGCFSCHQGIEKFTQSIMMEQIATMRPDYNDPGTL